MLKNKVIILSDMLEIEIFELDKSEIMEDVYKFAGFINKDGELLENFEGSGNFSTPSCVEMYLLEYIYRNKLVTITKDNIDIYYEFMGDEDLEKYTEIINPILGSRYNTVFHRFFSILKLSDFSYFEYSDNYKGLIYRQCLFGINDTLKPIDEYIEDIKASNEYKEYTKNNQ